MDRVRFLEEHLGIVLSNLSDSWEWLSFGKKTSYHRIDIGSKLYCFNSVDKISCDMESKAFDKSKNAAATFSPSCCDIFAIVLRHFRHRTVTFSPSYCDIFASVCCDIFTIVLRHFRHHMLRHFRHRAATFSPSLLRHFRHRKFVFTISRIHEFSPSYSRSIC